MLEKESMKLVQKKSTLESVASAPWETRSSIVSSEEGSSDEESSEEESTLDGIGCLKKRVLWMEFL